MESIISLRGDLKTRCPEAVVLHGPPPTSVPRRHERSNPDSTYAADTPEQIYAPNPKDAESIGADAYDSLAPDFYFFPEATEVPPERLEEIRHELAERVRLTGIEALAWYVPFHWINLTCGIFIPESSVVYVSTFLKKVAGISEAHRQELAFKFLYHHELGHFLVEETVAQWEMALKSPLFRIKMNSDPDGVYDFFPAEECMLTAYALRRTRNHRKQLRKSGVLRALRDFVETLPAGYKDAHDFCGDNEFRGGCKKMIQHYLGAYTEQSQPEKDNTALFKVRSFDPARMLDLKSEGIGAAVPVYLIRDLKNFGLPNLELIKAIPRVVAVTETVSFIRDLQKCGSRVERIWKKKKEKLMENVNLPGLDFKPWKQGQGAVYSMRLNDNFRVHLKPTDGLRLEAVSVGSHKAMGHG